MSSKSDQRIVDSGIHWWDLEKNYYPWLMDKKDESEDSGLAGAATMGKTYLARHYLDDAKDYNVEKVVHVEAVWDPSDSIGETRWLEKIAATGEDEGLIGAVVGFANLAREDREELLEGHASYGLVRNIRHMLNRLEDNPALCWAEEDFTVNPAWIEGFGLLEKYGLGFDLMCFSNMMHRMADLAHKHPNTLIVLEHTGMPHEHDDEGRERWRSGMKALAANDNVVAKISGLGNTIPDWTEDLFRPYVLETIDIFGTDRVMFGSNFPTDKQFSSFDRLYQAFLSITKDFSQEERDKMFADNAIRHYRIEK